MKKHEHFKKRDKIRETTSQMNPDIFLSAWNSIQNYNVSLSKSYWQKTDRISNAISIKLDKLR